MLNLNGAVKQAESIQAILAAGHRENRGDVALELYRKLAMQAQRMIASGDLSQLNPAMMSPAGRISLRMAQCWQDSKDIMAVVETFHTGIDELIRSRDARHRTETKRPTQI